MPVRIARGRVLSGREVWADQCPLPQLSTWDAGRVDTCPWGLGSAGMQAGCLEGAPRATAMWARIRKVRGRPKHADLLAVMPGPMCRGFLVDARHPCGPVLPERPSGSPSYLDTWLVPPSSLAACP